MRKIALFTTILFLGFLILSTAVRAQDKTKEAQKPKTEEKSKSEEKGKTDDTSIEKITQESIDKCKATESTKPTPKMIMEKIDTACKLIEKEGEASFPKFKGKDSEFIFAGTYIWIHDAKESKMLIHPIKPKMEGTIISNMRDSKGKLFFTEMNKVAKEKGSGWVEYTWPKPGEKDFSNKVSYVKLAKYGDKEYIAGCGVYDMTVADINKALGEK